MATDFIARGIAANQRQSLSSADIGKGAALVGLEGGGTAEDARTVVPLSSTMASPLIDASDYIQARLNQAGAFAAAEKSAVDVLIPPARFRCSAMLQIPGGVHLKGVGIESVIDVSAVKMLTAIIAVKTSGTTIRNLKIVGSGQGSQPLNGSTLTHVEIAKRTSTSGCGIIFAGVDNGLIEDVTIEDCGGKTGVLPYNGVAAIWLTYGCTRTTVRRCTISDSRNGINEDNFFGASPQANEITSNWIDSCRFGVAIEGYYAANAVSAKGCRITHNYITGCLHSGIDLNKAQRTFTSCNYIEGCGIESGNNGIWLYGTTGIPTFDNVIVNNQVYNCGKLGTGGAGIKIGPNSYYPTLSGNTCEGNAGNGVLVLGQCRFWSIAGGHLRGNALNGIQVTRLDASNVVTTGSITGVIILESKRNGILLEGAAEVIVNGNSIKASGQQVPNTYDGIRLASAATSNTIVNNRVSGGAERYSCAVTDNNSVANEFHGNNFAAVTSGRVAFANLDQRWGNNSDPEPTFAGAPLGSQLPFGAKVYNPIDFKEYRSTPSGWRAITTT